VAALPQPIVGSAWGLELPAGAGLEPLCVQRIRVAHGEVAAKEVGLGGRGPRPARTGTLDLLDRRITEPRTTSRNSSPMPGSVGDGSLSTQSSSGASQHGRSPPRTAQLVQRRHPGMSPECCGRRVTPTTCGASSATRNACSGSACTRKPLVRKAVSTWRWRVPMRNPRLVLLPGLEHVPRPHAP
jgi:hypothetical protein